MCCDVSKCVECGIDIIRKDRMRKKTYRQRGKYHRCREILCNLCWSYHLKSETCIHENLKSVLLKEAEPNSEQEHVLKLASEPTQELNETNSEESNSDASEIL